MMKIIWILIGMFSLLGIREVYGQEGLVGYWSFDSLAGNKFFDLGGHMNHGYVFGADLVPGIQGNALEFDGQNDYAKIGESDSLPELFRDLGEGSISLWFRADHIPRLHGIAPLFYYGGRAMCDFFDAANQGLILEVGHSPVHFESERLYFTLWKNGCTYPSFCFDSGHPIKKEHWYHYVVVVGPDYNTGFLNGLEMSNRIYNFGDASYSQFFKDAVRHEVLWLGKGHWDRTEQYLRGAIDELRIYNRALSAEEIEALYQENAGAAEVRQHTPGNSEIILYPNPATGVLYYDSRQSGLEIEAYELIDPLGKLERSVRPSKIPCSMS